MVGKMLGWCTRFGQKLCVSECKLYNFRGSAAFHPLIFAFCPIVLQGWRPALRGAVSPGAANPLRRLRPPDRREGRRRHQVRPPRLSMGI